MKLIDILGIKFDGPKFVVDNVAKYFYAHDKEFWCLSDFPMPRPPFDEMWIEYKLPKYSHSKELGDVKMFSPDDIDIHWGGFVAYGGPDTWIISGSFWKVPKHLTNDRQPWHTEILTIKYTWKPGQIIDVWAPENDIAKGDLASKFYAFHPILMAFSFCNCKNVEVVTVRPHAKLQQVRAKRGKPPFNEHRIINILPFGKYFERGSRVVTVQEGGAEKLVIQIRRGNYARYGAEFGRGLLFGKYSGMFWRPSIIKDSEKEYQVRAEVAALSKG